MPAYAVEEIVTNPTASARMQHAVLATARAIANEAEATPYHGARLAWAQRMATNAEARRDAALGMLALAIGSSVFQALASAGTDLATVPFSTFTDEAAVTVNLFARSGA